MAQDIKKLFKDEQKVTNQKMPMGHEARFLKKLDEQLPETESTRGFRFNFLNIAASIVLLFGLGYFGYLYFGAADTAIETKEVVENKKTIEDVSPELKKVEDYYLASINSELAKLEYSSETKELFDGYVQRLEELSTEYVRISNELIEHGPTEETVNALIDNLKMRLNLLLRLKEKLNEFNKDNFEEIQA